MPKLLGNKVFQCNAEHSNTADGFKPILFFPMVALCREGIRITVLNNSCGCVSLYPNTSLQIDSNQCAIYRIQACCILKQPQKLKPNPPCYVNPGWGRGVSQHFMDNWESFNLRLSKLFCILLLRAQPVISSASCIQCCSVYFWTMYC